MKQFQPDNIHNIVLLSHSGAGKTSLSEAILFTSGEIKRMGRVDADSTTSDYDPDEIKRKISINLTLLPCHWQDKKINLVDVPGYPDFIGEVSEIVGRFFEVFLTLLLGPQKRISDGGFFHIFMMFHGDPDIL